MKELRLEKIPLGEELDIINIIKGDFNLECTFGGNDNTISRILNSKYRAYIKLGNKIIGFVMIVDNNCTQTDEVDMGLIRGYTNKGYGTRALGILKSIIIANDLNPEIQIKKINISAIECVLKNNFSLKRSDKECFYYVLNDEDYKEVTPLTKEFSLRRRKPLSKEKIEELDREFRKK